MSKVNYVSIPFQSGYYMCVEGSKRANALSRAHHAWVMGYNDLSEDLFNEASELKGCAFEHHNTLTRSCEH